MLPRAVLLTALAALVLPGIADARVSVSALTASPSKVRVGQALTVRATAANVGPHAARASRTSYLLSRDRRASLGDVQLTTRTIRPLAAHGRRAAKTTVAVPQIVAPGRWHVLACVSRPAGKRSCRAAAKPVTVLPTTAVKRPFALPTDPDDDDGAVADADDVVDGTTAVGSAVAPRASIAAGPAVVEAEGTAMTFTVTLARAAAQPVEVSWSTADGTATAPADYAARTGRLTFAPGETSKTVSVPVQDDGAYEAEEHLAVALAGAPGAVATGTILDDDPEPLLAVDGTTVVEGDSGVSQAYFSVTLDRAAGTPIAVTLATVGDTATAGLDFAPTAATVTFAPGQQAATFVVPVLGDALVEPLERFGVTADGELAAYGFITDDD